MKRSRLRNIVNKAKELNTIKDPFDSFKNSLPIGLDYYKDGGKYRLKAAWEAYGKPKDFKEARWNGLIETFDGNSFIMPSIGYNAEKDSYEYLNIGKENEIVNKDLRAWDNNVIPFIKELKYGGYIKKFNEEEGYWSYVKEVSNPEKEIGSFLKGGKPKLDSKEAGENPVGYLNDGTPLYKKGDGTIGPLTKENIGKDNLFDLIKNSNTNWAKRLQDPNRKYITYPDGSIGNFKLAWSEDETGTIVYPEILEIDGQLVDLSGDREKAWNSAMEHNDYIYFPSNDAADWFTKNYKNYYKGFDKIPLSFKQGGQMNVIPEGALHARKNNMEGAGEDFTAKGIPVVDNNGEQLAEIEKEEWTMTKELTDDVEKWYKEYYKEDTSQKDKDELAIKCGKRITKELLHNTDDRANLIAKMLEEEE